MVAWSLNVFGVEEYAWRLAGQGAKKENIRLILGVFPFIRV